MKTRKVFAIEQFCDGHAKTLATKYFLTQMDRSQARHFLGNLQSIISQF